MERTRTMSGPMAPEEPVSRVSKRLSRKRRIEQVRARIQAGFYDRPEILAAIVESLLRAFAAGEPERPARRGR